MTATIDIRGLTDTVEYFESFPDISARAARLAINQVASRGGMRLAQDAIYEQVAFPDGYLSGDRLFVRKYAHEGDLEAIIVARKRATSLARFAQGQPIGSAAARSGIRVQVKRGKAVVMRRAWLVRLKQGASLTEDQYNVGLALRVNPGEKIVGKYSAHKSWLVPGSVALLYGPSVDQVFRSVLDDIAAPIGQMVVDEFFRQFARLA